MAAPNYTAVTSDATRWSLSGGTMSTGSRTAKDTEGCILPGVSGGRGSGYVTNSTAAEKKIVAMLQECFNQGERVWVRITENWQ